MFHTKFPAFNINYQMRQDTRPNNYKPKKKARQQRDTEVWILEFKIGEDNSLGNWMAEIFNRILETRKRIKWISQNRKKNN